MRIRADHVFDGTSWTGPADITVIDDRITEVAPVGDSVVDHHVAAVTPGLIDVGVSASGYAEVPSSTDPYAPERAYARMSLRYGVTTLVDVNNSPAPLSYLGSLADAGDGPTIIASYGRLTTAPSGRHDHMVDSETASSVVDALVIAGARLISVGAVNEMVLDVILQSAERHGIPVVVARQTQPGTPGLMLVRRPADLAVALGRAALLVDEDVYFLPQLHATQCWPVDGLLDAPDAHLATPVLPHCRNFLRSRGRIGKRIGRTIVGRYYGDREPGLLDPEADQRATVAAGAGRCIASSAGGETGVVPGLSIWHELERLEQSLDPEVAFACATSIPTRALGLADVGVVRPGARADLLLLDTAQPSTAARLRDGLRAVVVQGRVLDARGLEEEVEDLVTSSLREQG
ncbi:MAG: amidohydrolase family protein [Solirubrobacterales bacterium]